MLVSTCTGKLTWQNNRYNITNLMKVFRLAYCVPLCLDQVEQYRHICQEFMASTAQYTPVYSKRLKTHLVLHLVDNMIDFGPTDCYNTERFVQCITTYR